ncbi:membrane-associated protein, putative [Bodo saltans]|uniref:Membrane-associated protein, putative n=1 Tax=Bodo saltans TaxID=75058 RepID=A0A0S4JFL7_BODSA|nr:membrane-associated protein, putative [Bodo saltans]|eukprot:CUG88916.1 membrane-associated protein, putative [Bodo saltans]
MWTSTAAAASSLLTYTGLLQHKETLAKQLKPLQAELTKQATLKHSIDSQALRFPDSVAAASFVYFVAQTSVLFYWVPNVDFNRRGCLKSLNIHWTSAAQRNLGKATETTASGAHEAIYSEAQHRLPGIAFP